MYKKKKKKKKKKDFWIWTVIRQFLTKRPIFQEIAPNYIYSQKFVMFQVSLERDRPTASTL